MGVLGCVRDVVGYRAEEIVDGEAEDVADGTAEDAGVSVVEACPSAAVVALAEGVEDVDASMEILDDQALVVGLSADMVVKVLVDVCSRLQASQMDTSNKAKSKNPQRENEGLA